MSRTDATVFDDAPQHGPRPLPLFLAMVQQETASDPERQRAALAGLTAFQRAAREPAPQPMPVRADRGRAVLRDYGRGDGGRRPPVLVVPSLINPSSVLDLAPDTSLLRWLAARGLDVTLLDWGVPGVDDRAMDLAAHVETLLVPLIRGFARPPVLVGYCLGGTLALAAAANTPVAGLATLAAPWHFDGYTDSREQLSALWTSARPACEPLGLMPVEVLQAAFWRLDPARTVDKYAAFAALAPDSDAARAFVRLEDWANTGAPLPLAAAADLFERLIGEDASGLGCWTVGGAPIRPATIACPTLQFVSTTDRIVPADSAARIGERRDLTLGHVGMIVGRRAPDQVWTPLGDWIDALPATR